MTHLLSLFLFTACGTDTPAPATAHKEAPAPAAHKSAAADLAHGKQTVEGKCTKCHGSEVYTRADHKITSTTALEGQVEACSGAAPLTEDEKRDVTAYLAKELYHF